MFFKLFNYALLWVGLSHTIPVKYIEPYDCGITKCKKVQEVYTVYIKIGSARQLIRPAVNYTNTHHCTPLSVLDTVCQFSHLTWSILVLQKPSLSFILSLFLTPLFVFFYPSFLIICILFPSLHTFVRCPEHFIDVGDKICKRLARLDRRREQCLSRVLFSSRRSPADWSLINELEFMHMQINMHIFTQKFIGKDRVYG